MDARKRIEDIIASEAVVLFMKGTRGAPQCGFSARVVDTLDDHVEHYATVNVLADPDLRDAIKAFSSWPTIPQLYVRGSFVGGADIVGEMAQSGELATLLGEPLDVAEPRVDITDEARRAFAEFREPGAPPNVRLTVGRDFEHTLDFDTPQPSDFAITCGELTVLIDKRSARRADGVTIDFVSTADTAGFRIDNPNQPPRVRALSPGELKQWLAADKPLTLFDVRTPEERAEYHIEGSRLLDSSARSEFERLSPDTTLVFYCAHGVRSDAAAQHCIALGFRNVYSLMGGTEAYRRLDPQAGATP